MRQKKCFSNNCTFQQNLFLYKIDWKTNLGQSYNLTCPFFFGKIFWNWLGQLCTFFLTCNSLWKFCWKIEKWKWYLIKEEAMLLIVNMIYNVKIFLNSWEHSKVKLCFANTILEIPSREKRKMLYYSKKEQFLLN